MAKNYYVILGIGSDADDEEIKSAYREMAKRWHPDHSGEGSEPFLAIREAYETLCDPRRRRAHDEQLARERKRSEHRAGSAEPDSRWQRRCPVEPLVPGQGRSGRQDPFVDAPFSSLLDELVRGPWGAADSSLRPRGRRDPEEVHLEVSLTTRQARHGGQIRVWVPVRARCPACYGRGGDAFFSCPYCLGQGVVADERAIDIRFGAGLADGSEGWVPLRRPGMRDLVLVLHFRVAT